MNSLGQEQKDTGESHGATKKRVVTEEREYKTQEKKHNRNPQTDYDNVFASGVIVFPSYFIPYLLPSLLPYQLFPLCSSSFPPFFHPSHLFSSARSSLLSSLLPSPFFLASFLTFFHPSFQLNDPCRTRAAESDRARVPLIRTNQRGR